VWLLVAALAVTAFAGPALSVFWIWLHMTYETTLEALVRTNLFAWVVNVSGRRGARPAPVTMLGHLRDDVPEYTSLVNEWYRLSGEGMFVVVALVIMLRIDVIITLVAFCPLAAVVLATHWMRSRLPRLWANARDATNATTSFIGEMFAGVQAIKVAGAEDAVARRFASLNVIRQRAETRAMVAEARIDAVTEATTILGQGIVLLVGAGEMISGRFSVGALVLFGTYLEWMLQLPRRAGRLLSQQKTSRQSLARVAAALESTPVAGLVEHRPVFTAPPTIDDRGDVEPLRELAAVALRFIYPQTGRGIADIDLCIRSGTLTVITGPVGAGKSTLLEVLLGLKLATAGRLTWNGVPIADPATFMRPPLVAYKPQLPALFNDTVAENILLGISPDEVALAEATGWAEFADDVGRLPDGLETRVGSRGVRLSGGQLQRTAAARAHIRRPHLHVVDDLSSALDDHTEQSIWRHVEQDLAGGATYLIVSHRTAALDRADQILTLRDGRQRP